MLDQAYVNDHLKFINHLKPEFGQLIARIILEEAAAKLEGRSAATVDVPLQFQVSPVTASQCVEISVNGVHIGHVGI